MGAVGIFFIGSLICALAKNIVMLIAGRAIQGLASGGLLVLYNIIIADLFSLRLVPFVTALTRHLLTLHQGARQILWNYRQHMGLGCFLRPGSWWCIYRKSFLALVLLHQLYVLELDLLHYTID